MNIRKLTIVLLLMALIGAVACKKIEKANPEEEARNFGKYFVEKLSENQLDSLVDYYPQIVEAISLTPVESDTIMVTEIAPDQFELTLSEGVTLTVGRSNKGNFEVYQSRGLFSFPDDKIDLAKKTGMWEEGLTDAELNERIKDDDFFEYLNNSIQYKISNIITIGKFKGSSDGGTMGMGTQTLTNNSDVDLDGSEYSIVSNWTYIDYAALEGEEEEKGTSVNRGHPIKAHGTYTDDEVYSGYHGTGIINKIKWKLSPEQLREKFAPYTGNEYQEYLDSQSK